MTNNDISPEELQKCIDEPWYLYNKYVRITDDKGNELPKKEMTKEEWEYMIKFKHRIPNRRTTILK